MNRCIDNFEEGGEEEIFLIREFIFDFVICVILALSLLCIMVVFYIFSLKWTHTICSVSMKKMQESLKTHCFC